MKTIDVIINKLINNLNQGKSWIKTWSSGLAENGITKSRIYPGRTMLRAKDVYFRASTRKGVGGNLFDSLPGYMTWGIDPTYFESLVGYPYPYVLEKGTRSGTTPPRPVWALLVISVQLQQNLIKGLNDYLHKRINEETKKVYK